MSKPKVDASQLVREAVAAELESLIPSLRESMMKPQGIIHDGITCSLCSVSPIVGARYYCASCDMDICESCEPEHMCNLIKYKSQSVVKAQSSKPDPKPTENVNKLSLTGKIDYIMSELGFTDRKAVLSALSNANYNVNAAIEGLLTMNN